MPRAALLSIHARVAGTEPSTWEDPSLVQVWGPRYSTYVVPARDVALFTLGRYPDDTRGRRVAEEVAAGMRDVLGNRRMPDRDVAEAMGGVGNRIRYAAPTGTILIRWEGARRRRSGPSRDPRSTQPTLVWSWRGGTCTSSARPPRGIRRMGRDRAAQGHAAFDALAASLTPVHTPIGDQWILTGDEPVFRAPAGPPAPARLLPSGDTYYLLQGADRELLLPIADHRGGLWTSRVWPGAVLVAGEIVGTWRRAGADVSLESWRRLSPAERENVEAEAASLPLPSLKRQIGVRWGD